MLNKTDQETLIILQEECSEVIQSVSKIFRFGLHDPKPNQNMTNLDYLETELGDVLCLIDILISNGVVNAKNIDDAAGRKKEKLKVFSNIFTVKENIQYESETN